MPHPIRGHESMNTRTIQVALTGGVATGKTTVANLFAELGVPIVDADVVAREVVEPGSEALQHILEHFGPQVIQADGSLNRAALRAIIFEHPAERQWLESLLHPLIRQRMQQQARALQAPYVILVIPLLAETGRDLEHDAVIVVDAPQPQQLQRLQQRDKLNDKQANAILAAQCAPEQRLGLADFVIRNHGDMAQLRQRVAEIDQQLLERYAKN